MGNRRIALVMASSVLTLAFYRAGHDLVASGFLVFAIGQCLILSGAAMELNRSVPSFGAGSSLWAAGLFLISIPGFFPRTRGRIVLGSHGIADFCGATAHANNCAFALLCLSFARRDIRRLDLDTSQK